MSRVDNSVKNNKICPLAIPNQISTISMHTPGLVQIHWYLFMLSSGNETSDVSRADNCQNWWILPMNNPKPELYNINAHRKFGENPLIFTKIIIRKPKCERTDVRQRTDTRTTNMKPYYPATILWRVWKLKDNCPRYIRAKLCSNRPSRLGETIS